MNYKTSFTTTYLPLSILFITSIAYLAFVPGQSDFYHIIIPYLVAFTAYLYFIFESHRISFRWLIGLAVVTRFLLIFSFPNLSDDIYRFIWDGRLIHMGLSPYAFLPSDVAGHYPGLETEIFDKLNSQAYFSIYPPLSQLIFYTSTFFPSPSLMTETLVMKSLIFASEVACLRVMYLLLRSLNLPVTRLFYYALNPLIIVEIVGNLHFEGVMILFLLLTLLYLNREKIVLAALCMALSIGAKLLTLMFVPALLLYIRKKSRMAFVVALGFTLILLFLPLFLHFDSPANFGESMDLYMRKFEFNASLYYLLRWIGWLFTGYNTIHILGPVLTFILLGYVLLIAQSCVKKQEITKCIDVLLLTFFGFLILSMTVHPWYLCVLVALTPFTRFKFPLWWSLFIFVTYINYSYSPFYENLWIVSLEYIVVFSLFIFELRTKPRLSEQVSKGSG